MRTIQLTQGKVALVSDQDYEYLMQFKWHAHKRNGIFYASRSCKVGYRKYKQKHMHLEILNCEEADHADRDGLNNQRENLRKCSRSQNMANRILPNSSGYVGVYLRKKAGTFQAHIKKDKVSYFLGTFICAIDAARAYDIAAKNYHGNFARLNNV